MSWSGLISALKGGTGSGNFGHEGRPGKIGGSSGGGVAQSLASDLEAAGISNLKSGNCWVFAAAMYERLKQSGKQPVILDWSGHVDAAVKEGDSYVAYTPDGPTPLKQHWFFKARTGKVWKVHNNPKAMLKFLKEDYPGISPDRLPKLLDNFDKAAGLVGADWS